MASIGLIGKVVENLRNLQLQETFEPDQDAKKKEKIANCIALTNEISLATVTVAPQALSLSIETLLCLCDDFDSDVRTVADECLNKIIRAVADGFILKVQFELYREIKRNGAARCLKAALWRFGLLSHMIRPFKAKAYAINLTPCILEIAKRKEDIVIETLSQSLPLIFKTLGHYISDKDIQVLLKAFFQNVTSNEAILRRASANMLLTTCLYSRKPVQFINYVVEQTIDALSHTATGNAEEEEFDANAIYGMFGCLRALLPHICANSKFSQDFNEDHRLDHYICMYELCLFYAKFYTNHNVINAALETLVQLLQNPPKNVLTTLMSNEGITQRLNKLKERGRQWPSKISLSTTVLSEDNLESNLFESDMLDIPEIAPKIEKWMTEIPDSPDIQKVSSKVDLMDSSQLIDTKDLENYGGLIIGSVENDDGELESNASSDVGRFDKTLSSLPPCFNAKDEDVDDTTMSIISTHEVSLDQFLLQRNDLSIGSLLDNDVTLRYCCRLLASSFLMTGTPGQLMPDKLCRVSVKSLALNCLGNILKFYPEMLFACLEKLSNDNEKTEASQKISDILIFHTHSDPQIRGNVIMLVGYFLQGMFSCTKGSISKKFSESSITMENLMELMLKGLEDESTTTCRQTLTSLDAFLPSLLESEESGYALKILKKIPYLVKSPYFLVRIKLTEILSELPYTTIEYVSRELQFQKSIIDVLLKLLSDQDPRVRKSASIALTKIIPVLYYEKPHEDSVTRKAGLYSDFYLSSMISHPAANPTGYVEYKLLINNLVEPYRAVFRDDLKDPNSHDRIDEALSRIVGLLTDRLLVYSSKYLAYGCCEALSLLSETYLTTVYPNAWDCSISVRQVTKKPTKKISKGEAADCLPNFSGETLSPICSSLFSQTIVLLCTSPLSLDLSMHRHLLLLAGNLASGIACSNGRSKEESGKHEAAPVNDYKYWNFLKDKPSSKNLEQLLVHIMRVLNIFQHVIEDLPSPVQPVSKSSLPSLPSTQILSPKRNLLGSSKSKSSSSDRILDQPRLRFKFGGKDQMGSIVGQPHYLRLYELLRAAHSNYRVTLDQVASELYFGLLNACLQALSQILEVASITEAGRIADEILHYLQSTSTLSSEMTVTCVRQLLKCLFETNLLARWSDLWDMQMKRKKNDRGSMVEEFGNGEVQGFYEQCFQGPAKLMTEKIKSMGSNCRGGNEPDTTHRLVNSLQRKEEGKISSVLKILSRNSDQNSVSSFVRLFEPLILKSFIQYTISNSVQLQCEVLMLLSQLVQLHFNYCLLDSNKIFIDFVMKQFEYIEEGHIPQTERLVPKIFDFLVRLSYEKYHSKIIIGVPKIIQLCDGLMASGQPPITHCIPALIPVVEEMFLGRTPAASVTEEKELETTREVLMSMMLRLAEFPQIIELLAKCLTECRASSDGNGEEKWRRWSRQAIDTVLPLLASRKMRLETKKSYFALVNLFSAVSPTVFRPVDPLLKVLLIMPPVVGKNLLGTLQHNIPVTNKNILEFMRWVGTVNVILLSLISYAKEEAMLARLSDVTSTIPDIAEILLIPDSSRPVSGDPLNVSGVLEPFNMPPERILARLLFLVIGSIGSVIAEFFQNSSLKVLENMHNCDEDKYLVQQFSLLLQLCIQMFETGSHCKVANASMQLIQGKNIPKDEKLLLNNLNDVIMKIGLSFPILACQWTYLLTLLGYDDISFWAKVVGTSPYRIENSSESPKKVSMNSKILHRASMILLCDYVCENVSAESDRLIFLLENHIETMIHLADEPPVRELLQVAIHRDTNTSGMFLRAVSENCYCTRNLIRRPAFVKRLLLCLEGAHQLQSGKLLVILISNYLKSKNLMLSRMTAKIASRRVEMLLTLGKNEVLTQLSKESFKELLDGLKSKDLAKKHSTLAGLLNKLAVNYYDLEPLELDHSKPFDPAEVKNIKLDRSWYFMQVKARCCQPSVSYGCFESARLLSHLNSDECAEIFSSNDFNVKLLQECIIVGTRLTAQESQQSELDGNQKQSTNPESILFSATKLNLIQRIRHFVKQLPQPCAVLDPSRNQSTSAQSKYATDFKNLVLNESFRRSFFDLIPATTSYVTSLGKLNRVIESDHESELVRFAVLNLEICQLIITESTSSEIVSPREFELTLTCASVILRDPSASKAFGASANYILLCSATASLTKIVKYFFNSVEGKGSDNCSGLKNAMEDNNTREYALACVRISLLVSWLEKKQKLEDKNEFEDIPRFYKEPLKSLIVSVARQPLVNSFVLTPPLLWKSGCSNVGSGPTKCQFTLFSSEPNYIPELDVLEEFIFRISLLGWNSRQQFEEIWMVLLGVLNVTQLQNELESEATSAMSQTASLAVQAITNLLMQTLILPCPGNPNIGSPIRHPRDPQLSLQKKSTRRLYEVQDLLLWNYENFFSTFSLTESDTPKLEHIFERNNLEPQKTDVYNHAYGQLSISYLWALCSLHEDKLNSSTLALKKRRDKALDAASLDVNSCLRFLLELYSSWMSPGSKMPLRLLHEVVKSLLLVSELFVERSQFQWMLESCMDLWKVHLVEDEVLRRHLIVAICKASAVLTPLDPQTLDKVKRLIDSSLKSGSTSMRVATLHGILYLLQSAVLADCEETMCAVQPMTIEYIRRNIEIQDSSRLPTQSEEHQCVMWALVFFLLEHAEDMLPDAEVPEILELILSLVSSPIISTSLHRMFLQGLERLVATKSVVGKVSEKIVKISIERLRQTNPVLSLPALQLFLTCMYTDTADKFNQPEAEEPLPDVEPEILVRSIERSAAIFDKIKKAYPIEVKILCAVLSEVLIDFFPPLDILTKVISEFLSPQQPHPRMMSAIVFKVCEKACNSTQLDLLQTWVVFSIQNFIQSLPLIMSTWCLTCFFISTSMNPWLRALFPHVQSRIGRYEYEDKKILCLAAYDFYSQLTSEAQKQAFLKTFEEAAKNSGTPFTDILASFPGRL